MSGTHFIAGPDRVRQTNLTACLRASIPIDIELPKGHQHSDNEPLAADTAINGHRTEPIKFQQNWIEHNITAVAIDEHRKKPIQHRDPTDAVIADAMSSSTSKAALSLYRRSLKLSLDWAVHRHLWRGQALYIRSLFEANKNLTEPKQIRALLRETEKLLETWKHPDPYCHPTAPGGSKYERNLAPPRVDPPPPLKF
ncbi:hypothetical protein MCOR27_007189 [Pyricularia oryzae]|nr:hypothetical protein MCOR01_005011 [Pyricularia oryzae]KAI6274979.1 hypothetical protein MCOR27_007189 [Pyricularia oryzae]KAI6429867.1 hypothetical protein MCOR24_001996 [Pyricularia oryzae]